VPIYRLYTHPDHRTAISNIKTVTFKIKKGYITQIACYNLKTKKELSTFAALV
jgi:hypothetical protein